MGFWNRLFGKERTADAQPPSTQAPQPPAPAEETMPVWTTRPLFISSTFRDLQAERSYLRDHVFPRLEEALRQRHLHLEPIDLRVGVDTTEARTEAERELLVLKVCLDEVRRSRPFLLVLLGERYGWIPPQERMAEAAREQGFATDVTGKSVTALEIEYGLFNEDPAQRARSLFFLRAPLNLDAVPAALHADYSDADSGDPLVRAGYARLQALKERLRSDLEYAPRVFEYQASWDPATNAVAGLEAFGERVYEALWALFEEETRARKAAAPVTWERQEQQELLEFIEHRSRLVVGRSALLAELQALLDDSRPQAPWGACITGAPGLGKSAVFAALYRARAAGTGIVLASAAGGTTRGGSVDAMLRRFIAELDQAGGFRTEIPTDADAARIEALFHAGLWRAGAAGQQVVVLLDALDQFESTVRGQQLTWLRRSAWPPAVRLVATTQPGVAANALQAQEGVRSMDLPPLSLADAQALGPQVWQRYHRQLNPGVLAALTTQRGADGALACGNPLWLTLALEQLMLLDAEDFARAERDFAGTPDQRLLALVIDTAQRLPPDVAGSYEWLLAHTERAHGVALTQGFAVAIALSRQGWREADLLDLAPRLARQLAPEAPIPELNELRLATLRRAFRAHALRRGPLQLVDFFHAQMRQAVLQRYAPEADRRRPLHAAINDYLEALPVEDPLVDLERMRQLIAEHDALRAARYYAAVGTAACDATARSGATWTLVEWLCTAGTEEETSARIDWVTDWLEDAGLTADEVWRLAQNFLFEVADTLAPLAPLALRRPVLQAAKAALERLVERDPANTALQRDLSVSHGRIGDVLRGQGDGPGALAAYRQLQAIAAALSARDPANALWQGDLLGSHVKIGDVLRAQGDRGGALANYRQSLVVATALTVSDPANTGWQRDLSVNHNRIADMLLAQGDIAGAEEACRKANDIAQALCARDPANTEWQRDLSVSHERIGDVLLAQGDGAGAEAAYRQGFAIRDALFARDPANSRSQRDRALGQVKIGDGLRAQGNLAGALAAFRESLAIATTLNVNDPANAEWQHDLSSSYERIGEVLLAQRDSAGALAAFRRGLAIREALSARDPANTTWQHDLALILVKIGLALMDERDGPGAEAAYRTGFAIREVLSARDPANTEWQLDLAYSHERIGDALRIQGDGAGTLAAYRQGLAIRERLGATDPANTAWQRDLAFSHQRIGEVLLSHGDEAAAEAANRESLAIRESLTTRDPTNTVWKRDLVVSFVGLARVTELSDPAAAMVWWLKALEQLEGVAARGAMISWDQNMLEFLRHKVARE